jgi:hypothetical protein
VTPIDDPQNFLDDMAIFISKSKVACLVDGMRKKNACDFTLHLKSQIKPMPDLEPDKTPAATSPTLTKFSWD